MITKAGRKKLAFGAQLELGQGLVPWGGQNPRDLTESAIRFRLAPQGREPEYGSDAFLDEQCRRHQYGS